MKKIPEWLKIGLAMIVLGVMSGGTTFLFIKIALTELSIGSLIFYRYLIASLLLWTIIFFRPWNPIAARTWKRMIILGIINGVTPTALIVLGEQYVSSGLAGLIMGSIPLFTALLGVMVLKEKLEWMRYGGIVLGFLGVTILSWPHLQDGWSKLGVIALLMAACFYASTYVFVKLKLNDANLLLCGATACATSCLLAGLGGFVFDQHFLKLPHSLQGWGAITWLGVVCSAMDYLLFIWLVQKIGATRTSALNYITPVAAVLMGALILGEKINLYAGIGGAVMLLGVFITNHSFILKKSRC